MKKQLIHENWIFTSDKTGTLSATVPGCVHTDLQRHGILGDLYYRDNSKDCQWVEREDFVYSTVFDAEAGENTELVFEGLDTYAEVILNGVSLGKCEDMFTPYRFTVGHLLRERGNTLEVRFTSPIRSVEGRPDWPGAFTHERMNTRRMQCTYGWDWVDRFVTMGIFRPVYLEYDTGIDVEDVYVATTSIDKYSAQLRVEINFKHYEKGALARASILAPDGTTVGVSEFYANLPSFVRYFDIASPALWYPAGYGEQPLYRLRVEVGENVFEESFGIRTVKLVQLPDPEGSDYRALAKEIKDSEAGQEFTHNDDSAGFLVLVNGREILCRGGNWVPSEPFASAETPERIRYLVEMARKMGANFLRVWGGGIFEQDAFYTACDECGILVAQDFLMACGLYPEKEEWFIDALRRESEYAVRALRNHPSLAWWHGDNENAMYGSDLMEDHDGRDSALRGSAPNVWRLDPFRSFLPSSPYGGNFNGSLTKGTSHITNYIGTIFDYFANNDCQNYKEYLEMFTTRFSSEDGTFGAVGRSSILRFLTEEDVFSDETEEMMIFHTKNNPARPRHYFYDIKDFTRKVLGEFSDGEDRFFKYKYIQYEWVRVVFENVRRHLGYSNGMVFWMFNDCWPAALGWSFVDYYGIPKASYYAFRRCAKQITASVKPSGDAYAVTLSSSLDEGRPVNIRARQIKRGEVIAELTCEASISGYGIATAELPIAYDRDAILVLDASYDGTSDRTFYREGALPIERADGKLTVLERGEGYVTLRAEAYLHAVELEGEYLFEDSYFSMLAGEVRTVRYERLPVTRDEELRISAYTLKW